MLWRTLGLIHCVLNKRTCALVLLEWMGPDSRCLGRSIGTVTWKARSCISKPTRTVISVLIGRWKKKRSLRLVEPMKENVIAWRESALKFALAPFDVVWMPCVARME